MADEPRELNAGPLRVLYANGELRYLSVAGREVIRRIYMPVRDERWGTINAAIANERVEQRADGFRIAYDASHRRGEIDFAWRATIDARAAADGATVTFTMNGEARSAFRTCRTGFCVLHPIRECAGQPVEVEHPDGSIERSVFPRLISPHQPFKNIRAIAHDIADGIRARVAFEGDTFEMEDQRNWTDTSFKTYCRPLALPFPYTIEKGQRVRQSVTVTVAGRSTVAESLTPVIFVSDQPLGRAPGLGVQWRGELSSAALTRLGALNLAHLRLDVRPSQAGWDDILGRALADAEAVGVALELAVHIAPGAEADVDALAAILEHRGRRVRRVIVYEMSRPMASRESVTLVSRGLHARGVNLAVGGGTVGNFTELNRNRSEPGSMSLLGYPICPQIHATDDLSLIENLAAQGDTVRTARSFAPEAHLAVGPVSLARRPDPFAAGKPGGAEQPVGDPRQSASLGAAWTLGSIKHLAEAGANAITYYDATGPFGIQHPDGRPFPLYQVFADVGEFAGGEVLACADDPIRFAGLALRKGDRARLIVANLLWCGQHVSIDTPDRWRVAGKLVRGIDLPPYGLATFDFTGAARE